jgi:ABC-type transport system involved in multi-copper enzyme maturation permease subunit
MKTPKAHSTVLVIAKHAFADEVRQKSMMVIFVLSAFFVFLLRGCYKGEFVVDGQALGADAIAWTVAKVAFHVIAAGAMFMAALLTMRVFRRDRDEGMLSCVMSKPIDRWQYVTGKIFGLWVLSVLFMFILHSIVFAITSLSMKTPVPAYLVASIICSLNLLFVVLVVFLLSLLLPDIAAFVCAVGIGIGSLAASSIYSLSQSQMGQVMMQHAADPARSGIPGWKWFYYLWPSLFGSQQSAASLIGNGGGIPLYPLMNVLFYCLILTVLLFRRFKNEEII